MSEKLAKSTLIVSSMTMLSRILGLVRDVVIMSVFGAGGLTDAFLVAFKIPNFLRRLFSEGAFSQAFVPVLTDYKNRPNSQNSHQDVRILISQMTGALLLILSALTALVVAFAPQVIGVFAFGFDPDSEKFSTATDLLRVTFPYLLLVTLTAFAGSILQSYQRFAVSAFAPVLLNVCMIIGALYIAPCFDKQIDKPIMALGYAVAFAGLLQLVIHFPSLFRQKLLVAPSVNFKHEGVRKILRLMLPAIFGVSVTQINMLLNSVFASWLPDGSVSWLYTAERMSELPLGLIGVAIGTVILPSLSANATNDDSNAFSATLDWATRLVVLVGLPASVALLLISDVLIQALFLRGEFGLNDALMSGQALQGLAGGILGFMLIKVFAPAFFARQQSKLPVKIGLIAIGANVVFSGFFIFVFEKMHLAPHVGLAFANTLASLVNAGLLYFYLHKEKVFRFGSHWKKLAFQFGVANGAMALALWQMVQFFPTHSSQALRLLALAGICVGGALVYGLVLLLAGFRVKDLKLD